MAKLNKKNTLKYLSTLKAFLFRVSSNMVNLNFLKRIGTKDIKVCHLFFKINGYS
jgi:hypothetical protein